MSGEIAEQRSAVSQTESGETANQRCGRPNQPLEAARGMTTEERQRRAEESVGEDVVRGGCGRVGMKGAVRSRVHRGCLSDPSRRWRTK
ncbi:hypothetical protein [Haladaptatus sp. T7]|uniref:hypothetical protein n=1 Tax=Haladaptatus sp. T7 TaxID=2029368 RepID=UPI002230C151|nr:hypothetical protein [Haladaptatus sp. T7]